MLSSNHLLRLSADRVDVGTRLVSRESWLVTSLLPEQTVVPDVDANLPTDDS